ncbi:hypothetical protein D920_00294 [Enterococcus faecalis 13-SD-W-01]|nr:hypothetical protein D920_00294 [Enterococcus faecalis 13-SD-W-01]
MDLKQIEMLKTTIDCSYESGIWIEIDSFLEYREDIILEKKVKFLEKEEQYQVSVRLKEYSIRLGNNFFKDLVDFIEYTGATLYMRETFDTEEKYYILSETVEHKGFFLELTISQ